MRQQRESGWPGAQCVDEAGARILSLKLLILCSYRNCLQLGNQTMELNIDSEVQHKPAFHLAQENKPFFLYVMAHS